MKHTLCLAVSVVALGLGGCSNKTEQAPADEGAATMAAATETPAAAASPGQAFANTAAASDTFEIRTSQLAADKATSSKIKDFASQMIKAHTDSTAKLKTAAAAANPPITPMPDLTPMQQQTLDALGAKSGADFDTAYAKAQVDAHQATLDALKAYSANGDVPSLKTFATQITPVVTAHLNMAKGL